MSKIRMRSSPSDLSVQGYTAIVDKKNDTLQNSHLQWRHSLRGCELFVARVRYINILMLLLMVLSGVWGCAVDSPLLSKMGKSIPAANLSQFRIQDMEGEWEYRETSVVYPLKFDQKGNGSYEWKQGRFVTTRLEHGVWSGTWHQAENDREGEFEMQLETDGRSAIGRWWYTRIEQDRDPLEPGGTFTLHKISENTQR